MAVKKHKRAMAAVTAAANNFWIIFESANPSKASLYLQGLGLYIKKVNKVFRSKEPI